MTLGTQERLTLDAAAEEALRARHQWIGVEHLFLGVVRQYEGFAGQALETEDGLGIGLLRQVLSAVVPPIDEGPKGLTLTPKGHEVLGIAEGLALAQQTPVGPEHLLAAVLVHADDGVLGEMLRRAHLSPEELRRKALSRLRQR